MNCDTISTVRRHERRKWHGRPARGSWAGCPCHISCRLGFLAVRSCKSCETTGPAVRAPNGWRRELFSWPQTVVLGVGRLLLKPEAFAMLTEGTDLRGAAVLRTGRERMGARCRATGGRKSACRMRANGKRQASQVARSRMGASRCQITLSLFQENICSAAVFLAR